MRKRDTQIILTQCSKCVEMYQWHRTFSTPWFLQRDDTWADFPRHRRVSQVNKAGKSISDTGDSLIKRKVGAGRRRGNDELSLGYVVGEWSKHSRHLDNKQINLRGEWRTGHIDLGVINWREGEVARKTHQGKRSEVELAPRGTLKLKEQEKDKFSKAAEWQERKLQCRQFQGNGQQWQIHKNATSVSLK